MRMNRELAAYLFFDVPLYKNPILSESNSLKINDISKESEGTIGTGTDLVQEATFIIPKTTKKHVWFFGEKPTGEKKELLVKLLAAVQLKGSDVEFFFDKQPVFPFVEANPHIETVFIFGQESVVGELMQPVNQPQYVRNTALILTYSLEQLVSNTTSEKRNLWGILKKVYLDAAE